MRSLLPISLVFIAPLLHADEEPSAGPIIRLLQSGRVPESRLGAIVEMVCQRGNAEELGYVFEQTVKPDGYEGETRRAALAALADAALTRKIRPEGDLSRLARLITPGEEKVGAASRMAAVELAGLWKVEPLVDPLLEIALAKDSSESLRRAALDSLVRIGGSAGREAIEKVIATEGPALRFLGVAALARLDANAAAPLAAKFLSDATADDDPAPIIEAFLDVQGGAATLAAALSESKLDPDVAKLGLRYMYSIGRTDAELTAALSQAAGISLEVKPPTKEEIQALAAEIMERGDAGRGELVFRRADLSCMKCHAVSKAGGDIGPDLSALGASSPVDYVIKSVFVPDDAIKEHFTTLVVLTDEGKIYQGILVDRDDERLILKDATGQQRTIPADSIDDMLEGKSLMPKGLVNFMTHSEMIDLLRFLSELGKPGPLAVRSKPTMQRWRVLTSPPPELKQQTPDDDAFKSLVLGAPKNAWQPAYGKVAGALPLDELVRDTGGDVLYLYGEVEVNEDGEVGLAVDSLDGIAWWLDEERLPDEARVTRSLPAGKHRITLRVDTRKRGQKELNLELFKPQGSPAEFVVIDGR